MDDEVDGLCKKKVLSVLCELIVGSQRRVCSEDGFYFNRDSEWVLRRLGIETK